MDISATFQGSSVRIMEINVNGADIYITYVTTDATLQSTKILMDRTLSATTIATGVTVN
jgi:hypothetical protein